MDFRNGGYRIVVIIEAMSGCIEVRGPLTNRLRMRTSKPVM